MNVERTAIPGVVIIEPAVFGDDRGSVFESWSVRRYAEIGIELPFVQDNVSRSAKGVLRGLHAQFPSAQGKLVTLLEGEVYDVAVDIRAGSPTFGMHVGVRLDASHQRQVYLPPGLAHGFVVLSETALLTYKCTSPYHPSDEFSIRWDDPDLGIDWPVRDVILSAKDQSAMRLRDVPEARLVPYR